MTRLKLELLSSKATSRERNPTRGAPRLRPLYDSDKHDLEGSLVVGVRQVLSVKFSECDFWPLK